MNQKWAEEERKKIPFSREIIFSWNLWLIIQNENQTKTSENNWKKTKLWLWLNYKWKKNKWKRESIKFFDAL